MEKQQFLYVVKATRPEMLISGPTPEEQAIVGRHFAYLKDLTDKGVVVLVGRTQTTGPETMGLCIYEAADEAAARVIMDNDPAILGGVMTGTLYPYKIALMRGV
ncbi:YciI family protein [Terrarubrum flagellatum]|uniref:YciI family protein n=1 Tax=Terrirubrum flagellatum TaxID=2895980 RepID=UPI0031454067